MSEKTLFTYFGCYISFIDCHQGNLMPRGNCVFICLIAYLHFIVLDIIFTQPSPKLLKIGDRHFIKGTSSLEIIPLIFIQSVTKDAFTSTCSGVESKSFGSLLAGQARKVGASSASMENNIEKGLRSM